MRLTDTDRAVLRASLRSAKQGEIAEAAGVSQNKAVHSLLKLQKAGAVRLTRKGQGHEVVPTPSVAAILTALERLEESIAAVLEHSLSSEAAA